MSGSNEIVQVSVGGAGNRIGSAFWEVVSKEHGIEHTGYYNGHSDLQLEKVHVYFNATKDSKYIPRCVMVDTDTNPLSEIRGSKLSKILNPDNYVVGNTGTSDIFARGFYTNGAELMEYVMDVIRNECESCDCLQGFQFMHGIGGGTGSGLGSLILQRLYDEYRNKLTMSIAVTPSPRVSDRIIEPYNAMLAFQHLIERPQMCILVDNEALYDICFRTLHLSNPTFLDLNHLVSAMAVSCTASLRFPGLLNTSLRSLATNLVPFPRVHFFMSGIAPLSSAASKKYRAITVAEVVAQMFNPKNMMCAADPRHGRYLTATCVMRGRMSNKKLEEVTKDVQNKNSSYFVEWIPNNVKVSVCDIPSRNSKISGSFLANNTAMLATFRRAQEQYSCLFKRKAWLHWYTGEGMDEAEFKEASSNVKDLISEYQNYQDMSTEDEDEEEWDED